MGGRTSVFRHGEASQLVMAAVSKAVELRPCEFNSHSLRYGRASQWVMAAVLKTVELRPCGFDSHLFRHMDGELCETGLRLLTEWCLGMWGRTTAIRFLFCNKSLLSRDKELMQ